VSGAVSPLPSRVLMTTDAVGGVFTYAVDMARGLGEAGVDVTLAVLGPGLSPDQAAQVAALPSVELVVTGLTLDWMAEEPALITAAGEAVADLARRSRADLVHLNSPALAACRAFDLPVVGVAHSCLATWWAAVRQGPMPEDFAWRTHLLSRGYFACDALVAPSAAFAMATARRYGVAPPTVVHNGRRPAVKLDGGSRDRCVITGGRLWDEGKNIAALEAAAERLNAPVLAAGPLRSPAGDCATLKTIQPLGRLSESMMAAALRRAPVFASLALYEPFGLTVLEAAQAGCALVLSDIPTFRELWSGAAVLTPPGDELAAAAAIQALLDDPAEAGRLGAAACRRAARFTPEAMVDGMLRVYAAVGGPAQEAVA